MSQQLFDSSSAHLKYQSLKPRLINLTQIQDGTLICQPVMATYVKHADLLDRLNKNSDKNFNLYNVWQINLKEFFYFCPWAKLKIVWRQNYSQPTMNNFGPEKISEKLFSETLVLFFKLATIFYLLPSLVFSCTFK